MLACLNVARRTHTSTSIRSLHPSRSLPLHTFVRSQNTASIFIFFLFTCELRFPASSASHIYQRGSCFKNKNLRVLNKTSMWTKLDLGECFFYGSVWWYQLINITFSGSTRMWKVHWLLLKICAELALFISHDSMLVHLTNTESFFLCVFLIYFF